MEVFDPPRTKDSCMSDTPDSQELSLPYHLNAQKSEASALTRFLTHLVFQAHGMRIGLELSLCVLSYTIVSLAIPWQSLGVPMKWSTLISWFGCCFVIILLDQLLLCRSVYTFRRSYLLAVNGAYEKALELLELIGPSSSAFIKLPNALYHLHRAEVFVHSSEFDKAEEELQLAEYAGIAPEILYIMRSRFYRAQGELETAAEELEAGTVHIGPTSLIKLEQGVLELERGSERWKAKQAFEEVLGMSDEPHFSGESCHVLAKAYLSACQLRTGEAEEGLEGISKAIDRLRSAVMYVDTLRPVLTDLMLSRSHYLATHREPGAAALDLKIALAYCSHPRFTKRGEEIREELQWRHQYMVPA